MSTNIIVKNKDRLKVTYNNIDTVVLPTADGGTAVFRKWNGIESPSSKASAVCISPAITLVVPSMVQTSVSASLS